MRGATGLREPGMRSALILAGAFAGLSLLFDLPVELAGFGWAWIAAASLEVAVVFLLLALAPALRNGRSGGLAAAVVALATMLVVVLKLAGLAMNESLARPLNLLLDLRLAQSLVHLLTETLGPLGWICLAALALLPLLVGVGSFALVRRAQRELAAPRARHATLAACGLLLALFAIQQLLPQALGHGRPVAAHASATLLRQWRATAETLAGTKAFEAAIARDRFRTVPPERLLARLNGADVLLMFVESYGRSALDQPRYADALLPALADFERRLGARGLVAASGWLTSPTVGGQSWLAHGTLESGLWLANQARHDALMHSARLTLTRAFGRAGYRTVALKPAITRPWPEGEHLGFARIYAAADLGYAGPPYNWVTMPDQYTLSVLERRERARAERPLFVEVSLISSHAPWTPIAPVLDDWSTIGDGSVFPGWTEDDPEVVWRDLERIRAQYARAIDYVLGVLASYAANFVDRRTLLIVVGDHQPAPLITGEDAGRDVPIHVISGDPALLAPFEAWGLAAGMRPPAHLPARRMDAFRDFFLEAFSAPAEAAATVSDHRTSPLPAQHPPLGAVGSGRGLAPCANACGK